MNEKTRKVVVPLLIALVAGWFFFGRAPSDAEEEARIRAMLDDAIAAWEAQDLDGFMAFFDKGFQNRSGGLTYGSLYMYHRERIFGSGNRLEAELENVEVRVDGDTATVTFDGVATIHRERGGSYVIVGQHNPAPIVIELEKFPVGGGLSHEWKAVFSAGIEEGYGGDAW